jgi:hypothetical protein
VACASRAAERPERKLLSERLGGVALASAVEGAAVARENLLHALRGSRGDVGALLRARRSKRVEEDQLAAARRADIDPIEHDDVEVDVEPESGVTALDDADGAGERIVDGRQAEQGLRAALVGAAQAPGPRARANRPLAGSPAEPGSW